MRSEFTSHVLATRPFLAGRVSFLKAAKHGPSTHRYAWRRRLAVTLFICTAANNNAKSTRSERLLLFFLYGLSNNVRLVAWSFECVYSSFRYSCSVLVFPVQCCVLFLFYSFFCPVYVGI